MKYIPYYCI